MNKMHHCLLRVTMETNALEQSAHERDLAPLFGDLSQSEKLSEIKLPLSQNELMEILYFENWMISCDIILNITIRIIRKLNATSKSF